MRSEGENSIICGLIFDSAGDCLKENGASSPNMLSSEKKKEEKNKKKTRRSRDDINLMKALRYRLTLLDETKLSRRYIEICFPLISKIIKKLYIY